jgi:hypothetical protein
MEQRRTSCSPALTGLTQHALTWLEAMSDADCRRRCGFEASNFDWLLNYAGVIGATDSRF